MSSARSKQCQASIFSGSMVRFSSDCLTKKSNTWQWRKNIFAIYWHQISFSSCMTSPRCLETMDTVVVEDTQVMEMPSAAQWAAVLYMKSVLFVPACQPKLFYLPAAHWAAASTFSIHFHIVEKNLETLISTNHANFQRQISQKNLKNL